MKHILKKLKGKNVLIFCLFLLLTGGVIFATVNDKLHIKNSVANKIETSVSIGVGEEYDGWEYGEWEITSLFTGSGSNISISADGTTASVLSEMDDLEENIIELTIRSRYQENTLHYDEYYWPLDLYYELPLSVLSTENIADYYYNSENNRLILTDYNGIDIGFVDFGDALYCETSDNGCWESVVPFIVEVIDGVIYVYNGDYIYPDSSQSFEFTFGYSLLPNVINFESPNKETIPLLSFFYDAVIELNTLVTNIGDGSTEEKLSLDTISYGEHVVYDSWQPEWGVEESGYDYYIQYDVSGVLNYSNNYFLLYAINTNGKLLAYSSDGLTYNSINTADFNNDNYCNSYTSGELNVICKFIVGYDMGNSVTFDSSFVLYLSLLNDTQETSSNHQWVETLEKSADINVEYPTGTNKAYNQTLVSDDAGIGAINKIRSGKNVDFTWKIEPTAVSINNTASGTVKAFNIWNLTSEGTVPYTFEIETSGATIDESYNSVVSPLTLSASEYIYKSFYLMDDIEYDYVLNNGGNAYILSESAINTYTGKFVYAKISDGEYELIGTIGKNATGNITYVAADSRTSNNSNVTSSNPVVLPSNVTDLKITYVGLKAGVYIGLIVDSELKSTENLVAEINGLIVNNSDIVLKNEANVIFSDVDNKKLTGTYLTSAYESNTYFGSDSKVNDVFVDGSGLKYDSITYTDYVYEQVDFTSGGDSTTAKEYFTEQKNVTIYELLPIGAVLDGNVKVTTYGNDVNCTTNVTSTENYDGTGRTLLKIDVTAPNSNIVTNSNNLQSGYNVSFNVLYSYLDNQSYGNILYKDMAYYSNGILTKGFVSASEADKSSFSSGAIQNTMNKLNTSNSIKNSVYNSETTTVNKVTVTVGTFVKETKNEFDSTYVNNTIVMESENYKYRLKYVFSSDYEEITNLVFVDKLESDYGNNKYFKGYLESIDTSYLDSLGVDTTIYYSTDTNVNLDNIDLTNINSWFTIKPSDSTKIVAVAISCGNYVFKGSSKVTPMVDINMIATNDFSNENVKKAYNTSKINYNYLGDSEVKTMSSSTTSVELEKASIKIDATTSVGSGSEAKPAVVENSFDYEVTLKNTDDKNDLENITFEVLLPNGLSVNIDDISEVSSDVNGVFGSYSYNNSTRVVTYSISKILAKEEKNITIPVKINYETLGLTTSFKADVQLKTLGGKEYNSEKIILYNKLAVPDLEFAKYVDTKDTDDFTDEATVIIEKGETYSYKVYVNNKSVINANDVKVVDNVPSGLTVITSSITNGGVYDSSKNTITWNLDTLTAETDINLGYSVKVSDTIALGTVYRSGAHISVINPIDNSLMLYDDDTNIVSTLYQIVSNLKVTNNVSGNLADKDKEFTYVFEFNCDSSYAGNYSVVNGNSNNIGTMSIDSTGKGSYTAKLKHGESVEIKLLPNGINYSIRQNMEEGYQTTSDNSTVVGNDVVITGVTAEEKQIDYSYLNSYSVSSSIDISAEVTYDKEMTADMFALTITDENGNKDTKYADEFGIVNFDTITYDNVDGTYIYTITQENTNVNKVSYDTNTYTVKVVLTNDGKGHLSSDVKYFNKNNEEISDVIFNNLYVPNGLIINNVNTSDYVDSNKVFKYKLDVIDSVSGSYVVQDMKGNKLTDLVIDNNGVGTYEFELKSDEKLTILDLPNGSKYTITQELVDYYTSTIEEYTYTVDTENKVIIHSGDVLDATLQINFNNNYVTSGSFTPSSAVKLLEKELEVDEFTFMLKDVSEGLSNGYFEYVSNTLEGNLNFTTIEYTRPGTYVYELIQVKGDSNHIYYDLSKCILTVVLVDNGDNTMTLESATYEYENGKEYFENTYSEEPIVPPVVDDETINDGENPNTSEEVSKFAIVVGMLIFVSVLFIIEKYTRKKRLSM